MDEYELNLKLVTSGAWPLGAVEDELQMRFPGLVCRQGIIFAELLLCHLGSHSSTLEHVFFAKKSHAAKTRATARDDVTHVT